MCVAKLQPSFTVYVTMNLYSLPVGPTMFPQKYQIQHILCKLFRYILYIMKGFQFSISAAIACIGMLKSDLVTKL